MAGKEWSDANFGGLPSVLVAAHELKTPLALIRQLALLLDDDLTSSADKTQIQQRIIRTSEQALQLTIDLANSANLTPSLFPLEPVNPLALCQQVAMETKFNAVLYGRKVSWPKSSRNSQLILANRTLLGRILANFLNNALAYTEDGSEIKVSVKATKDAVRMSVRDFGPMMSLKEYRLLLDEMETRKTVRTRPESSGLGIYVANQFARAMNGRIGLIRHRDGLTFYVEMPIVEDDKNWADILGKFAADVGAEHRVVVSGGQAIEIIDDWRPDAVILDMLLAGETAIALLNELRSYADLASLPIVVCTNIDVKMDDLRPLGVKAILNKTSMRPNEARAIFREVLNDGAE